MADRGHLSGFRASLVAQGLRVITNGLVVLLLTRVFLSPESYGRLFLAISLFGAALLFCRLGIPKAAARYVTEYRETDPAQVRAIVRTALRVILATTLLVGTLLVVFRHRIAETVGDPELAALLVLGLFYLLFRTLNSFCTTVFQGFNRITYSALLSIGSNLGLLAAILALSLLGYGAIGALSGYVLGYALGTIIGLFLLVRTLREFEREPLEDGLRRRILEYSVPLTATSGANVLYKRVDTLLVAFFLTPVAVGFYTLAKQLSDFIIAPADSLGFTIASTFGTHKTNDDEARAARMYESTFEQTVLAYLPAAAGLVLVARPTIELVFGADYAGAVPVLQVFAAFVVLQAVDKITNDGLDYLGRARHRAMVKTSTGVANFGLNLLLIPSIGVVGAAVATVLSYGAMVSVNVYLIHTELSLALGRLGRSLALVGGVTVGMAAVVTLLRPLITDLVTLGGVVAAGGAVWALLAYATGIPDVDLHPRRLPGWPQ